MEEKERGGGRKREREVARRPNLRPKAGRCWFGHLGGKRGRERGQKDTLSSRVKVVVKIYYV